MAQTEDDDDVSVAVRVRLVTTMVVELIHKLVENKSPLPQRKSLIGFSWSDSERLHSSNQRQIMPQNC